MKLLFELVIQDANTATKLDLLRGNLKEINKELRSVDQDSKAFESLAEEAALTRVEIQKLTDEQKALKKEFAAAQVPTDSLAGLRIEYSKLIDQVNRLSKAERETEQGKALIANAARVKGEINEIQESVGNFTGNVGNYKNSILSASDALGTFGGSLAAQGNILQSAVSIFEGAKGAVGGFFERVKDGGASLKENVAQFREYLSSLRETKKVSTEAAEGVGEVSDAVESTAETAVDAGAGLTEGAKGATLFTRAGNLLRGVLAGLGIGLVIALITGLIGVFQKFAPVVDFVEQVVAGLSAAFDVLVSRAAKVATAVGKLFSGDFSGAFDDATAAVSGIGEAMSQAAFAAAGLRKEMQDLEDAQKDFQLTTVRTEAAVARLSVALKDKTKSDSERLKIAAQITKLEEGNLAQKTALLDKELDIERRNLLLTGQITEAQANQIAQGNFELARQLEDEFKLQQDQADRIREILIKKAQAEGESATLLERVNNRRNAILEESRAKQEQAAQKAAQAAEKETKALEAQAARIRELQKSIKELDATTLTNDFDRQATDIENKRADALDKLAQQREALTKKIADQKGIITQADKDEQALISENTASIIAAYEKQLAAVQSARDKALAEQAQELATLSLEVQRLAEENATKLAEAESIIINSDFSRAQTELTAVLAARKLELTKQLAEGTIDQKKFKDEYLAAQVAFNVGSYELEKKRAEQIKQISNELLAARIESAKAELAVRVQAINDETEAQVEALKEQAQATGGDATQAIEAKRLEAIEKRKAAELDYQKAVRDATKETEDAQLDAIERLNEADQKAQDEKLKRIEEEKEKRKELQGALLDAAGTISNAIFEIENNRINNQLQSSVDALDAEFAKKREAAQGNADLLAKLDEQYAKRKEALEKDAARKRKRIAITEAIVQGALAVVKALPNLILAALAAVVTAAQVAVISSQTFAQGGIAQFRKSGVFGGRYHSQGGTRGRFSDGTEVEVEKDEIFVILNRRASKQINRLSDFNYLNGGRKFATGGTLDFTPQVGQPGEAGNTIAVVAVAEFTDDQIKNMALEIATQTADKTQKAVALGLDDKNRQAERELSLEQNRQV